MNYPNPVMDFTSFYFEHNKAQEELRTLEIMDLKRNSVLRLEGIPLGHKD